MTFFTSSRCLHFCLQIKIVVYIIQQYTSDHHSHIIALLQYCVKMVDIRFIRILVIVGTVAS